MNHYDDTAGLPLTTYEHRPVPARAHDPVRLRLEALESALKAQGQWSEADLVGWLVDDLDSLPAPWARIVRVLARGAS